MSNTKYLNYNGKILKSDKLIISPDNRSFRYGDGFFETMKMLNGKIILSHLHFERLFSSLDLMKFTPQKFFTKENLEQQIIELAEKNNHSQLARIRLTIFRSDGGLYDDINNKPNYLIQTWAMNETNNQLNENGLTIDIFPDAKKACDNFSNIKSNNYLPYIMAALWAKQNKLNDALVLNAHNRIADATIANIFIVQDGIIKTPALAEGCVSGVTRKYLLQCIRKEGIPVEETSITKEDIFNASEIFLTNAGYGIRWVKACGKNNYQLQLAAYLHRQFIQPLYA